MPCDVMAIALVGTLSAMVLLLCALWSAVACCALLFCNCLTSALLFCPCRYHAVCASLKKTLSECRCSSNSRSIGRSSACHKSDCWRACKHEQPTLHVLRMQVPRVRALVRSLGVGGSAERASCASLQGFWVPGKARDYMVQKVGGCGVRHI
jgi:hypothetical protein